MKIKVIGIGSMYTPFNSASYKIDDDILVDVPNGMCKYLLKMDINPRNITNVLLTHFHGDHYFDMPFLLLLKSKSDNKALNIYCSKEGKTKIKKLLTLAFPNPAREIMKTVNPNFNFNETFKVNDYTVTKYLVNHGNMKPAFSYIFKTRDKLVGFTGDTSLCNRVEYLSSVCSYLFCDCMLTTGNTKHMGIDNLKYLIDKYPECTFIVSHIDDNTREELQKLKLKNVIIPTDGLEIEI